MSGDANKVVTASYDRTVKVNSNLLLILDLSPLLHIWCYITVNTKIRVGSSICYLLPARLFRPHVY